MVTIINMKANGMDYSKMTLFTWAILITAVMLIISLPVLASKNLNPEALNLTIC